MRSHGKKMIAPIIISVIMVIYYFFYFCFLLSMFDNILKYVLGLAPLAFCALMIAVCIERIKEIKKGEEDDISKY